jgi:hypothetical protein
MHPVLRSVLSIAALATCAAASGPVHPEKLMIVLDFQGPHSERSVAQMKQELEGIMKDSGLTFDWRLREDAVNVNADDLVVVRFRGKCIFEPVGYLYDERGVLAFTHTSEGAVLPFSEVACDKVAASIRSAMFGGDYAQGDVLMGKALGRVLAHELVHILTKSGTHGHEGVQKAALSGNQLISRDLPLSSEDLKRLQTELRH